MADWYCVSGASGGTGTLLDPWGTLDDITQASLDGTSDTLWLSGTFEDQELIWDSAEGIDADNPILIRGDLSETQAIIDSGSSAARDYCLHILEQDYVSVKNLTVKNAGDGSGGGQGLAYTNSSGSEIRNVLATGNYWNAFNLTCVADMLIADCEASDNLIKGISLSGSYVTCQANVSNVIVQDSQAYRNGRRGLTISGANAEQNQDNCHFIRCISSGNGEGVQIDMCINCSITDSIISDNNLTGVDPLGTPSGHGIWVQDCVGTIVANNSISGHTRSSAIHLQGVAAYPVSVEIYGNIITHPSNSTDYCINAFDADITSLKFNGNYVESLSTTEADANSLFGTRSPTGMVVQGCNNTFVGGYRGWRHAGQSGTTDALCKNNIFLNQISGTGHAIWWNNTFGDIDIDNNCYWVDGGTPQIYYKIVLYAGADIDTIDTNAIREDPELDSNYKPGNQNLIGTGIDVATYAAFDINEEPFPRIDRDVGCVQGTDSTNHPFHPLNI